MATNGEAQSDAIATLDPMENNVAAIARVEEEAIHGRSLGERIADAITRRFGSMTSVTLHLAGVCAWVAVNLGFVPGVAVFDPFPFGILTLIVSGEGVLLALLILVSQNRIMRQADRRAHLDLQVSMLAEQELTLMLRMQERLCEHFGVDTREPKEEIQKLMEPTDVARLVNEIAEKLPEE